MGAFRLFGVAHFAALATIAALSLASVWWARQRSSHVGALRPALALALLSAGGSFLLLEALAGVSWRSIAPLHVCDVAVVIGAVALLTRAQLPYELLYFWGCAASTAALLTPDIGPDFPHYRFLLYFAQHGLIVVAATTLAFGMRRPLRPRAPLWAWLWLNAYAAFVGVINAVFDTNFMYLCSTPGSASPLDWFGPWPIYIVVVELLALGLFYLLAFPLRRQA